MAYTIPAVDDFKAQFPYDFPYAVPAFGASAISVLVGGAVTGFTSLVGGSGYAISPIVTLTPAPGDTGSGATATATVSEGSVSALSVTSGGSGYTLPPIVSFSLGAGDNTRKQYVSDAQINGAILDAQFSVNPGFFSTQQMFTRAYLYLAAHELADKLLMQFTGVKGTYSWLTAAKTVGDVSQSFAIPKDILGNPFWASLARTRYGAKYIEIVYPLTIGNVMCDLTFTNP